VTVNGESVIVAWKAPDSGEVDTSPTDVRAFWEDTAQQVADDTGNPITVTGLGRWRSVTPREVTP